MFDVSVSRSSVWHCRRCGRVWVTVSLGEGRVGKTEFPQRWDDETIKLAVAETWTNPALVKHQGDKKLTRKIIDGVLVEVSAYGDGHSVFFSAFPRGGRGVIYNDKIKDRVRKRITQDTTGWEVE